MTKRNAPQKLTWECGRCPPRMVYLCCPPSPDPTTKTCYWPKPTGVIWRNNVVSDYILLFYQGVDRSQSLFYFVPQEKRLIWRPCWGWKNMGESFFHQKNGPTGMKKPAKSRKACTKLPWELAETSFRSLFKPLKSFFWGFCLNCTKSPQQGFLQGCIFIFLTTAFPDLLVGISQLQRRFSWTKQLAFKQNYS